MTTLDFRSDPTRSATRDLQLFRLQLQPHLDAFIARKLEVYTNYSDDPFLALLLAHAAKLASGNGKRIRPYVAHLMFKAQGGEGDETSLLIALELFHLFCLVHDDIIDRGTRRYDLPTTQRFIFDELQRENRPGDAAHHEHIAVSQAMLLGDLIFSWSQESFHATRAFPDESLALAQIYFGRMMDEVVIGQMIDVDMTAQSDTSLEVIRRKLALKTASYTFIRPLQIGAALAGRGRECEKFCAELGLALGVAFQLQDDLLDLLGTSAQTHKTVMSDLREGQHTYFTQYIRECGTDAERADLSALLGSDLQPNDRARVTALFVSSGAVEHGRQVVRDYLDSAARAIEQAKLAAPFQEKFCDLVEMVEQRAPLLELAVNDARENAVLARR